MHPGLAGRGHRALLELARGRARATPSPCVVCPRRSPVDQHVGDVARDVVAHADAGAARASAKATSAGGVAGRRGMLRAGIGIGGGRCGRREMPLRRAGQPRGRPVALAAADGDLPSTAGGVRGRSPHRRRPLAAHSLLAPPPCCPRRCRSASSPTGPTWRCSSAACASSRWRSGRARGGRDPQRRARADRQQRGPRDRRRA